ncbi:MAG: hypothetical protein PHX80_05275 [Candidatus Nanoarchaeia archaeon]|nr:hypothetical protein [Candidatus Nanoarchaeia archaeon]
MIRKPLLIGLLLSKDDGDIIHDVMTEYNRYFDTIFCIDASSDNSLEIIKSFPKVEYAVHESELGIIGSQLKDGIRQLLLSKIQDVYGYDGWIFPIHSDEVFWGDPASLVDVALSEGANVLNCLVAHFILHEQDYKTETQVNITDRKHYYFMGQCENCGFKNQLGLYYNFFEHMRTIPHGFYPLKTASKVLVRRHYNMRNIEQLKKRAIDRIETGWQPAYKNILSDPYITDPKQLITAGEIYSDIEYFNGNFNFKPGFGYWNNLIVR